MLRRKPLSLVAYLARRGRAVPRTELATLFWGERGDTLARQSLRQALSEVKQALGDRVDVDTDLVRLAENTVSLDIIAFENDVAAGRLEEAVGRWAGDFFEGAEDIGGESFRRWVEAEREGLHRQLGVAMQKLIGDAERRGDWTAAAAWAERWARALPFDEQAHLRLIEAYRMSGRSGEALTIHAGFVSRMRAALDVEPSVEFLALGGGLADSARTEQTRKRRGSAALHTPALAGRAAVMDELAHAWSQTTAGSAVVVLVRGDPGSGLTRLCEEIAERAASLGLVLRGRGEDGSRAYATAGDLFDGLRHAPGAAGAEPEALAEVARIVPGFSSRFRHLPAPTGDEAMLRDALVRTLAAIAEERPVLVLLDDIHAADEASRNLITGLATRLPARVMLLVTDDEGLSVAADALGGLRGMRRLQLEPLSPGEVEAMLSSMLTMEAEDRRVLATRVHEESGGLPYAVRELATALVDDHLLQSDAAGSWRISPALAGRALPMPARLREGVRARLERLSPAARAAAEAVAVFGQPADATVIGLMAELPLDDAEQAIGALVARRLVRESPAFPGHYAFAAPIVARAVVALLPPSRRQVLHARAAEAVAVADVATTAERNMLPYHVARAGRVSAAAEAAPVPRRRRRAAIGAAVLGAATLLASAGWWWRGSVAARSERSGIPVVALGRITDYRENAPRDLTQPLTDMLATNLGRVRRLRVVSTARMYELMSQADSGGSDTSAGTLVAAARRAGATELVDGALYARAEGGFRLDLRRVELRSGSIRQTHSVSGATVFELADSGTARLAADFGETSPLGSVADVTTRSLSAYRLYEQGLRAYYANDLRTAEPLFEAALTEDSTFAMAAYYAALSTTLNARLKLARFATARRLAARASDRERLTISAQHAYLSSSPALLPFADTLVVRYPEEVEGYYFTGLGRLMAGDFLGARAPLNRVVAMDSLALTTRQASCEACDALRQLVSIYQHADSLPAAEREAHRWARLQPESPVAWGTLAAVLSQRGKVSDARAAFARENALETGSEEIRLLTSALHHIYAAEYDQAERLIEGEIGSGTRPRMLGGFWYRVITRRSQGRFREALADARRYREMAMELQPRNVVVARRAIPGDALGEGQVLYEMGRFRASAAVFDSISRWVVGDELASEISHNRAWAMTHAAGSLAAAGDTTGLGARADTIEALGAESGSGRDRLLHHYVRGLLLAARGQDEHAAAAFRASVWSWNFGYTRANVALAAALMRLGRPGEAVSALQAALRGNIEGSNFYMSRTELHERLGHAWDAVGGPAARDSAAAHFAVVLRGWSRADSSLAPRLALVRTRAAALAAAK